MSCERNPNRIARLAGPLGGGIAALAGQPAFYAGAGLARLRAGWNRARSQTGRTAGAILGGLESFDPPASLNVLEPALVAAGALWDLKGGGSGSNETVTWWDKEAGLFRTERISIPAWLRRKGARTDGRGRRPQMRHRMLLAASLAKLARSGSLFAGTGLARLSRLDRAGAPPSVRAVAPDGRPQPSRQKFFFERTTKIPVDRYRSHLTRLLNRQDAGLARVLAGEGVMLENRGKTWHLGTTVVRTGQGQRTITHLQSLTLPAAHYYFDRRLSENEAVGIIAGQKGFEPKFLPGYVGGLTEVESLSPTWAAFKRSLIKAHIFWGEQKGKEDEL